MGTGKARDRFAVLWLDVSSCRVGDKIDKTLIDKIDN